MSALDLVGIAYRTYQRGARIEALVDRWKAVAPVVLALAMNVVKPLVDDTVALAKEIVPSLNMPAKSYSVAWVQDSLNRVAGEHLIVDGKKGPATDAAVERFQMANGLEADSWVGTETGSLLDAKVTALEGTRVDRTA